MRRLHRRGTMSSTSPVSDRDQGATEARTPVERAHDRIMELVATDPEVAAAMPDDAITRSLLKPGLSSAEILSIVLDGYADRPALGSRAYEIVRDPETGSNSRHYSKSFETITYGELKSGITALANAWRHHPA